jgi:hypothetical protein
VLAATLLVPLDDGETQVAREIRRTDGSSRSR